MVHSARGPLRFGDWIDGRPRCEGPVDGDGRSAEGAWVVGRAGPRAIGRAAEAGERSDWSRWSLEERVAAVEAWVADLLRHGAWVEDLELRFGLARDAGDGWLRELDSLTLFLEPESFGRTDRRWLADLESPLFEVDADPVLDPVLDPGAVREEGGPTLVMTHWSGLLVGAIEDVLHELVSEGRPVVLAWGPELPELGEALGRSAAATLPRGAFALLQRPPLDALAEALEAGAFGGLAGTLPDARARGRLESAFEEGVGRAGLERCSLVGGGGIVELCDLDGPAVDEPDAEDPAAEDWGRTIARSAFGRNESLTGQLASAPNCLGMPERRLSAFTAALLEELELLEVEQDPVPPLDPVRLRAFRELVVSALDEGATLIHGAVRGRRADWGPVVLTNVEPRMSICSFEGALPVLALIRLR